MTIVVRNESGVQIDVIDPDINKEATMFTLTASSSIDELPTAEIGVNLVEQFSGLNVIDKHFNVEVILNDAHLGSDQIVFSGTYLRKEISFSRERGFGSVKIRLVHSFYKVMMLGAEKRRFHNVRFVDFLYDVMQEAKVRSTIKRPETIEGIVIDGAICEVSPFRLIKEVCFRYGLVMIFERDDTIRFEHRERMLADRLSAIPMKVTGNDIISLKRTEGL